MYTPGIPQPRRPNLYGTLHDNACVDTRPFEDSDDYEVKVDVQLRQDKPSWSSFVDLSYIVAHTEGGRVRAVTHMTMVRVTGKEVNSLAKKLLGCLEEVTPETRNP